MDGSFRIGRLFGIPIMIHFTFLLIIPIFAWLIGTDIMYTVTMVSDLFHIQINDQIITQGYIPYLLGFVIACGLFLGVFIHELAHSLIARRAGITINSITLLFFGGVASIDDRETDPQVEFWMALAGPAMSTPFEIFHGSFPDSSARADDLTIISWISPVSEQIKLDNRSETDFPSERGARTKYYSETFQDALTAHLVLKLKEIGIRGTVPPSKIIQVSSRYGLASAWSERHAAYVSGHGTFGLCDGLITRKGKAVICGCVIAQVVIPPTTREYADHHAWCLHYAKGRCDGCIKRCPASAVNSRGHDKMRCREYCFGPGKDYMREQFGFDEYVCGLCQSAVPCE